MAFWMIFLMLGFTNNVYGWVKEMENPGLYEGDMVLSPEQKEQVKKGKFVFAATSDQNKLWAGAVVPYEISSELTREPEFMSELQYSLDQYHKYTCLRFKKRTNERAYIQFYKGGGCSSLVGTWGGRNRVSLAKGCWWRSTIMHEIGHSLGFHHEQARPDRDDHVTILFNNVHAGTEHNFKKQSRSSSDSRGTPYDYLSMMHYNWNAFGKNGQMTIKTKDPRFQYLIGQDNGFSEMDIKQLNLMYKCSGTYPTLKPFVMPPPGCHDIGGACVKGAHEGNCHKPEWKTWMHSKCRLSCGLCGGGPSGPPVTYPPILTGKTSPTNPPPTKGPDGSCSNRVVDCHLLGKHRCNDPSTVWVNYMKKSCKKYCNFC